MSPAGTKDSGRAPASVPGASGTFGRGRRWFQRLDAAAAVLLAVYCVVVLNIIVFRHPVRIDLTEEGLYSLSDETLAKLELVREDIDVVVSYYQQPRNPKHLARTRVLERALELLKEYHAHQPRIEVVDKVNAFQEPDRWRSVCEKYDLEPTQLNRLIFLAGKGHARKQAIAAEEIAALEAARDPSLPERIETFRGETAINSALMKLVHRERELVYFLQGHGELPLKPGPDRPPAMTALAGDLEASGYEARELDLSSAREVPEDCAVLVVAGSNRAIPPRELELLESYLRRDGRLLVCLGPRRTGLEEVLERWGTEVREGSLRTRIVLPGQRTDRSWVRAGEFNAGHALTEPFRRIPNFEMLLFEPRPLAVTGGQRTVDTEPVLETGESTEARQLLLVEGDETALTEAERRGDYVLATASRARTPARPPPGYIERKTRLVVIGASNFLRDTGDESTVVGGYLSASHRSFFMNAVHWLAGEESLLAAGGRSHLERQLPTLDRGLKWFLLVSSVGIFPGVFALIGIAIYFVRRT